MQRTKFCRSPKTTSVWWVWEREHEPDCLSNLQFVSGGGGKRQFLYYIFSYLYTYRNTRIDDEHMQYIFNIWMYRIRIFMYVCMCSLLPMLENSCHLALNLNFEVQSLFVHDLLRLLYTHTYIGTYKHRCACLAQPCVNVCVCACAFCTVC